MFIDGAMFHFHKEACDGTTFRPGNTMALPPSPYPITNHDFIYELNMEV